MDLFIALKLVHVTAAAVWFGGGICLALFATIAECRGNVRRSLSIVTLVAAFDPVLFTPAAILTLMSGAVLFVTGPMPWTAWSVLALPLVAMAFSLGAGVVKPTAERIAILHEDGHDGIASDMTRRLLRVARLESAIMLAVIALMVARPDWRGLGVLTPIAAFLALAGATFLMRRRPVF